MATGDITYTKYAQGDVGSMACGSLVADISEDTIIQCGFQPSRVCLFVKDADGTANYRVEWNVAMGSTVYTLMADGGDITFVTTATHLPFPYAQVRGTNQAGFLLSTELLTAYAADDDVIYWEAYR